MTWLTKDNHNHKDHWENTQSNSWKSTLVYILYILYIEIYKIILTQDLSLKWIDQFLTVSDIPPPGRTMHQSLELMQKENWVLTLPGILLSSLSSSIFVQSMVEFLHKLIRNIKTIECIIIKLQRLHQLNTM